MKRTIRLFLFAALIASAVAGCMKPPAAPSWETELDLPLLNKSYYAYELEDSVDFVIENDSLFFIQHGDLTSVGISDEMNIHAHEENFDWLPLPPTGTIPGALSIDETGFGEDDIAVSYAVIEHWMLEFAFQNADPALQTVSISFDDIYDQNQNHLVVDIDQFDQPTQVDLSGAGGSYYSIGSPDNTALYDSLAFQVTITSGAGAPTPVTEMMVRFDDQIYLREMHGLVYRKELTVNNSNMQIDIEYPDGAEDALLIANNAARLELSIWNQLGYTVELHGRLTAYNDAGESRSITFDEADNLVFEPATTIYDSTLTTHTIRDSVGWMLNIFPTSIVLENARFIVGRSQGEFGFSYSGAEASGDILGRLPFLFRLTGEPINIPEPQTTEITGSNQQYIEDYALSGKAVFVVENQFPASASVEIFLSTSADEDSLYNQPILHFPRDGETSYVGADTTSTLSFALSTEDVLFFANSTVSIGVKLTFDQTQGNIYVAPRDSLALHGRSHISLMIDNE